MEQNKSEILPEISKQVISDFSWRDRTGVFHKVEDMDSRHLYYTVMMIWNHSVPEIIKFRPFREHVFSSFYTGRYMLDAVVIMLKELSLRYSADNNQLEGWMIDNLSAMRVSYKQHYVGKHDLPKRLQ